MITPFHPLYSRRWSLSAYPDLPTGARWSCGAIQQPGVCDTDFDHLQSHVFCEDSGWGDEEATVVCRDQLHSHYGIGGIDRKLAMPKLISPLLGINGLIKPTFLEKSRRSYH